MGAFGTAEQSAFLTGVNPPTPHVDAVLVDGVLSYMDHSMRALV